LQPRLRDLSAQDTLTVDRRWEIRPVVVDALTELLEQLDLWAQQE
jgi:hypothetical protein